LKVYIIISAPCVVYRLSEGGAFAQQPSLLPQRSKDVQHSENGIRPSAADMRVRFGREVDSIVIWDHSRWVEGQDNCRQGVGRGYQPIGTSKTTTFSSNDPKTCCISVRTILRPVGCPFNGPVPWPTPSCRTRDHTRVKFCSGLPSS